MINTTHVKLNVQVSHKTAVKAHFSKKRAQRLKGSHALLACRAKCPLAHPFVLSPSLIGPGANRATVPLMALGGGQMGVKSTALIFSDTPLAVLLESQT